MAGMISGVYPADSFALAFILETVGRKLSQHLEDVFIYSWCCILRLSCGEKFMIKPCMTGGYIIYTVEVGSLHTP